MTDTLHTPDGVEPPRDVTWTRRGAAALALGAGLGAGYAAAVRPVNAQDLITTDAEGLLTETVEVAAEDDVALPAYVARPAEGGPFPTVIVVNEIFGIHAYIEDVCRRFAKAGYFAIAPAYFHRAGDPSQYTWAEREKIFEIVNATPHAQVMRDSRATYQYLQIEPAADAQRLGITGFCWGGRVVWTYTAQNPAVKAGVAWYGRLVDASDAAKDADGEPVYPVEVADKINGRVLGLYAGEDRGIPLDTVETMRAALKAAGDEASAIVVYDDAQHGFHADYRPSYDKAAAEDGWARLLAWFDAKGVV